MEKKKINGRRMLLTSLTIAGILSSLAISDVYAEEHSPPKENKQDRDCSEEEFLANDDRLIQVTEDSIIASDTTDEISNTPDKKIIQDNTNDLETEETEMVGNKNSYIDRDSAEIETLDNLDHAPKFDPVIDVKEEKVQEDVNNMPEISPKITNLNDGEIVLEETSDTIIFLSEQEKKEISSEKTTNENLDEISTKVIDAYLNKHDFIPGEIVELTVVLEGKADYLDIDYISDSGRIVYHYTYANSMKSLGDNLYLAKLDFLLPEAETQTYNLNFLRHGDYDTNHSIIYYNHNIPFDINFKLSNPYYVETEKPEILDIYFEKEAIYNSEATNLVIISSFGESIHLVDAILHDKTTDISNQYWTRHNHYTLSNGNVKTVIEVGNSSLPSGNYQIKRSLFLDKFSQYFLHKDFFSDGVELTIYDTIEEIQEEKLPFEIIYQHNSDLLVGTQKILQEGKNGLYRKVEKITYLRNEEISREIVEDNLTNPINQIVHVGTKAYQIENNATVVKEETRAEKVEFKIEYVDNPDFLVGTEKVSRVGKDGVQTIVEEVTTVGGKETNRVFLSAEVTEEPVTQIVQVGTKAYKIEDNATVVKEETHTEKVEFEIEYVDNPDLLVGTERVFREGEDGIRTIITRITTVNGENLDEHEEEIYNKVTTNPINQIVQIGTKAYKIEDNATVVKEETRTEKVEFEVEYVENPDLLVGTKRVSREGKDGKRSIVEEVSTVGGEEMNRKVISNEIITTPVNQIIQIGTKAHEIEDIAKVVTRETRLEEIPYETDYTDQAGPLWPYYLTGELEVVQEGRNGQLTIIEEVTFVGGKEIKREVIFDDVTIAPVTKIIGEVVAKWDELEDEGVNNTGEIHKRTEDISFKIEYVNNPDLWVGIELVMQDGFNGVRTIVEEITFSNGKEITRKVVSDKVTTKPINKVVQIGTKAHNIKKNAKVMTEKKRTEVVVFEIKYVNNSDLLVGTEKVSQVGVNGIRTIIEEITTVGGEETNRETISDEVTTAPVNQIVQVGTKAYKIEDNTTAQTEEINISEVTVENKYIIDANLLVESGEVMQAGGISAVTLPETGEKENFTNLNGVSIAILSGLGLIAIGKKKAERKN